MGDPLSPFIFLMCFNPILEYLDDIRDKSGFNMDGCKVITTPYADDFNLLTSNKLQHQTIINDLQEKHAEHGFGTKTNKMPIRVHTSICSGVPEVVDFHIDGKRVTPVKEDPHRFLGSLITHSKKMCSI